MKKSARKWWMSLAALLTLAFIFIWPPVDYGSASPHRHVAQAGSHDHQVHTDRNGQHSILNVKMDVYCDATALGCCMMAHCCLGISVGPQDLLGFVRDGGTTVASAVRGTGRDPAMVLPPPRRLLV